MHFFFKYMHLITRLNTTHLERISQQHGLDESDELHLRGSWHDLGFLLNDTNVLNCQAVEKIVQNQHDEEDPEEKYNLTESLEAATVLSKFDAFVFDLASQAHDYRLHHGRSRVGKVFVVLFRLPGDLFPFQEDKKGQAKRNDDGKVPVTRQQNWVQLTVWKMTNKWLRNIVTKENFILPRQHFDEVAADSEKHSDVGAEGRVPAEHEDHLRPSHHDNGGGQGAVVEFVRSHNKVQWAGDHDHLKQVF